MNQDAKELGMSKTKFDSPHGLGNPLNYSTAEDQCKLIAVGMKIP